MQLRLYLQDPDRGKAILKLDFRKAFNTIHRDWMLNAIWEHTPIASQAKVCGGSDLYPRIFT